MPMQKVIVGVGVAWLLVVLGSISFVYGQAATPTGTVEETTQLGRDLFLTIGFEIWPNQWETEFLANAAEGGANIQSATDFSVGFIPTLTLTYKRFFISASYMVTPKYDFGTRTDVIVSPVQFGPPTGTIDLPFIQEIRAKASRQEGDVTVGYFPLDWLGVAIGWKGVFQSYEIDNRFLLPAFPVAGVTLTEPDPPKSESITRYNGPIFGVLGSARINDSFALLGNAFGGYMFTSCTPGSCAPFNNGTYAGSKIVLRYAPTTLPQLSLTLGYRVQVINTDIDDPAYDSGNAIDLTHGPVFGVNYRF
jgi:hypothetical protein